MAAIPDRLEEKWRKLWAESGVYKFDRSKSRPEVFSIDTPPPTVSGFLHPGHACSYAHIDFIARFQRMRGKEVFFPMGWDDNGLNTERRVQLMLGITCDPSLPYDPDFEPPAKPGKVSVKVSRPNFVEQCAKVTETLEEKYFELWSDLGLSVDWSQGYTTIGQHSIRTSQAAFLRLRRRGLVYRAESPTLWDIDYTTAVAQAELEDRQVQGAYHRLRFQPVSTEDHVLIDTTRPELLPACVALVAHPDDERYQSLFGTDVVTPLFGVRVPVVAHELADPEKGTGIAMICTFGDTTDVTWWRELGLPLRMVLQRTGRFAPTPPAAIVGEPGLAAYAELAGKNVKQAQRRIVEMLADAGDLVEAPRPIEHSVKFWENGTRPLEIITNQQWFVKYPPKEEILARGKELQWWPEYMHVRYENWTKGLIGDWNITRQRYFGVPFPVWYPIDGEGAVLHERPIFARGDRLPIDPSIAVPDGFMAAQRNQPNGFAADPDVMDTWATSSLTPEIAGHAIDDPDLFGRVFPMDLRPQAHEIIRTWLFYTVVRSQYDYGMLPWKNTMISGFVTDPDRKKLSKSVDNSAVTPEVLIAEYGSDPVRYWASGGRPGQDTIFDRNQIKIGRRLTIKIANFARFIRGFPAPEAGTEITAPLDRAMLACLGQVITNVTDSFEAFDYKSANERVEAFFWALCDHYLELVKERCYEGDQSALAALGLAQSIMLRMFAPVLPFITEEVWSWTHSTSIHRERWPELAELPGKGDPAVLEVAVAAITEIRKAKTGQNVSMRADLAGISIAAPSATLRLLGESIDDIKRAARAHEVELTEADTLTVGIAP
jgi:valyl-tRNA synthetase